MFYFNSDDSTIEELGKISKYWKEKAECYNERSDEGANTDSQDEYDHGVQPTDTNAIVV